MLHIEKCEIGLIFILVEDRIIGTVLFYLINIKIQGYSDLVWNGLTLDMLDKNKASQNTLFQGFCSASDMTGQSETVASTSLLTLASRYQPLGGWLWPHTKLHPTSHLTLMAFGGFHYAFQCSQYPYLH